VSTFPTYSNTTLVSKIPSELLSKPKRTVTEITEFYGAIICR
jgi:hypothetical protein